MKRIFTYSFTALALLFLLTACGVPAAANTAAPASPAASATAPAATQAAQGKVFTAEELAKFDGKNGSPAYIAVDGVVYDVSAVPEWKGGSHWGKFQAGRDLTVEIKTLSPHGVSKLQGLPVMGTLAK